MVETFDASIPSIVGASFVVISLSTMAIVLFSMFGRARLAGMAMLGIMVGMVGVVGGGLHSRTAVVDVIDERYRPVAAVNDADATFTAEGQRCTYDVHSMAMNSLTEDIRVEVRCTSDA
jgi:hypothetical protein